MKDSAWYNKLWQQKMQELPLQGDGDAAWKKMQDLLDKNMPVSNAVPVQKPVNLLRSALIITAAVITIAVILYLAGTHFFAGHNNNNKPVKQINKHTALNNSNAPKTSLNENSGLKDSLSNIKQGNATSPNTSTPTANSGYNASLAADQSAKANNGSSATNKPGSANNKVLNPANQTKNSTSITAIINAKAGNHHNYLTGENHITANKNIGRSATTDHRLYPAGHRSTTSHSRSVSSSAFTQASSNKPSSAKGYKNSTDSLNALLTNNNNMPPAIQPGGQTGANQKADSAALLSKSGSTMKKPLADSTATKNKTAQAAGKAKSQASKKASKGSKFEMGLQIGFNSSGSFTPSAQNANFYGKSPADAFLGIAASYYVTPKLGVGIGINGFSPKVISGSYSKNNLNYNTQPDTGKAITHNTGKVTITGSRKIYTIDVPVLVTYKLNSFISFTAGPVISIPVKQETMKSHLNLLTNTTDTTTLKTVTPYVSSTTIINKTNFSFSAGVKLNYNRFFIDAGYLQNLSPYTISSGLGSNKLYYHTVQFGIGYYLFKPKGK